MTKLGQLLQDKLARENAQKWGFHDGKTDKPWRLNAPRDQLTAYDQGWNLGRASADSEALQAHSGG